MDCNSLRVFINTISIFSRKRITLVIFSWKIICFTSYCSTFSLRSQIRIIVISFFNSSFCSFTVVNRFLYFILYHCHFCNNSLNLNKLVDKISFKSTRSHIIFANVSFKIYIINLNLFRETIILLSHFFFI